MTLPDMAEIRVKICGMKTRADMEAAASAGAAYVGLNFFARSARSVSIAQAASLASEAPVGLAKVGLVVNPTDADLDAITGSVPLDMIQLHGQESVERVAEIKSHYGLPVMKVIGVAEAADLTPIDLYAQVADQIMIDAKAPKGAKRAKCARRRRAAARCSPRMAGEALFDSSIKRYGCAMCTKVCV